MTEIADNSNNSSPMVTDEDMQLIEMFFRGICYDFQTSPAYTGELSAVNMEAVYVSNEEKYRNLADEFCKFVEDAFKTSEFSNSDGYAALDAADALMC